jgi:tetratricopeptide (TPR) repeat protein
VYDELGRYEQAQQHLEQAIGYFEQVGDVGGQAGCYMNLMPTLFQLERYQEMLQAGMKARALHETLDDPDGLAHTMTSINYCLTAIGEAEQVIAGGADLIDAHRRNGDPFGEGVSWGAIASAYRQLKRYDEAIAAYRTATQVLLDAGVTTYAVDFLKHIGDTCECAGDRDSALEAWREALTLVDEDVPAWDELVSKVAKVEREEQ